MPAVALPGGADMAQITALLALVAALLTFVEYVGDYPSIIEFRDAPPFNRLRFLALFATVAWLTVICRGEIMPTALTQTLDSMATTIGHWLDFPFSPVRLMVLLATDDMGAQEVARLRSHAGLAYGMAMLSVLVFVLMVRLLNWPIRRSAFNFWVNLPLFDPTVGKDVLYRLNRDGNVNVALGFLLPFLVPAVMKLASQTINLVSLAEPQTLIWTMSAWAFLPASLVMRGVALMRIAALIEEKRRRAYAQAEAEVQTI
ncbi:hypothetical protein IQ782_11790 [Salipiger pacificus]|uniref:Uncharacterized protein n=2 Tax=Salipiger mangrovisoli TaxID=2865933 RepID=A0ABR9X253_9RHOB|nr:hypothetical protein [Salipiger mangrovisoli]MBE9637526.1 hypothetical protein [Salipiger mangrovisoli]